VAAQERSATASRSPVGASYSTWNLPEVVQEQPAPGQQQELVFCPKATGGCGGAAHPGQQQVLVTAQENGECGEAAAPGPAGAGLTAQEYFSTIVFMAGIVDCFH